MRLYLNVSAWQFAYGLTLSFFMLVASAEDIQRKRISNILVFMMLCAGIIFNTLELPTNTPAMAYHLGPIGARWPYWVALLAWYCCCHCIWRGVWALAMSN